MYDPDIPDDLYAGDASLDFSGMYLSAASSDGVAPEARIKGRTSVRETVVRTASVPYPPVTGTRVSFSTELEALLSYPNPPEGGSTGTVVTVRTASGDVNHHNGMVFVRWDDGRMMRVYATHLNPSSGRQRVADAVVRRASGLGDLGEFLKIAKDTLVHKATKDLWSIKKVGEEYVIERLFDETGDPLKV
jgi:hypothetical protein